MHLSGQSRRSPVKFVAFICAVFISLVVTTGSAAVQLHAAQVSSTNPSENTTEQSVGPKSTTKQTTTSQTGDAPTFVRGAADSIDLAPKDAGDFPVPKTLSEHDGIVYCIAFSPDGKILASGDENGAVNLWNVATGNNLNKLISPRSQHNPDEKVLIRSLSFSPDSATLATGNTGQTTFGTIRLWDVDSGKNVATFDGADPQRMLPGIYSVTFSPNGKTLATGHEDNVIRLWNASSGKILSTFEADINDRVYTVAYSPKGETLASAGPKGVVKLWDVASGEGTTTLKAGGPGFEPGGLATPVFTVTFSSDEKLGGGCGIKGGLIWDVAGRRAATFGGKRMSAYSVAFSPDSKTLAVGCDNGKIELWDTTSRKRTAVLNGHTALVRSLGFHPDGKTLASASDDNSVKLWNVN